MPPAWVPGRRREEHALNATRAPSQPRTAYLWATFARGRKQLSIFFFFLTTVIIYLFAVTFNKPNHK